MWEEEEEVKKEEKREEKAVLAVVVFVLSGKEEGKKLCSDFSFSKIQCKRVFSKDQYSDQVEYGTNLDSSLSWRKYL